MAVPVEVRVVAEYRFCIIDTCVIKTGRDGRAEIGEVFRAGAAFHCNQLDVVCHMTAQDGFDAGCDGVIIYAYRGKGNDMKLAGTTVNRFTGSQDML